MLIESERISIKDYEYEDYKDLYLMLKDKKTAYYVGSKPMPDLNTSRLIMPRRIINHEYYKIVLKDDTFIGDINFYRDTTRKNEKAFQIGFVLKEEFRHKGYMKEALKLFLSNLDLNSIDIISAISITNNYDSKRLIESLGFKLDGIRRRYKKMYDNSVVDVFEYSLTREELLKEIELWQKN